MIKKLQKRFIFTMMISVFIVFSSVMVIINTVNYRNVRIMADEILDSLAINNGEFQTKPKPGWDDDKYSHITGETPFETRYFSIQYNFNGEVININTSKIAVVNEELALEYANEVIDDSNESGYLDSYRFRITENTEGKLIIFMDCTKQLYTANEFLKTSIIVSISTMFAIFVIAIVISKKAIEPIARSYEKQKKFITDASHELKTPLTIIYANAELLEIENGTNENTTNIMKQVDRLSSMTKNLVLLSKIDESEFKNEVSEFSLTDATIDVYEGFNKMFTLKGVNTNISIEENLSLKGNERLIRQLIYILLDNAYKYSVAIVNFSCKKVKNEVVIEISNDTKGIQKGDLIQCCDRFYRTDESRASSIEGSGIGLSIAQEIVLIHHGDLKIFSNDGVMFNLQIKIKF